MKQTSTHSNIDLKNIIPSETCKKQGVILSKFKIPVQKQNKKDILQEYIQTERLMSSALEQLSCVCGRGGGENWNDLVGNGDKRE